MARIMSSARSVLIVEDEPLIAMMLEDFIESMGHTVVSGAETVEGALALIEVGGFDFVILDVHLRGRTECWPIADALVERGIPFILATGGHTSTPPAHHADVPTLVKPFTMESVRVALAKGIATGAAA